MLLQFYKYHGTGNDFILIDNRQDLFESGNQKLINRLCNRRFGIGADGLMLLSGNDQYDFEMKYFNADGLEGSLCGNGARCIAAFAYKLGVAVESMHFKACDGIHEARMGNDQVRVKMNDVNRIEKRKDFFFLDTGSPHTVFFRSDARTMDVFEEGKKIRYSKPFEPMGTNVDFIHPEGDTLFVRTYERGVENETLSCGTGVVASAICSVLDDKMDHVPVSVETRGGMLEVDFTVTSKNQITDIWLSGPIRFVFEGKIETQSSNS
jgi:diaminopimelate epimerase